MLFQPGHQADIPEVFFIINIIISTLGLVLTVYYYRRKKNILSIFLMLFLLVNLIAGVANAIGYLTSTFYLEPIFTFFTIIAVIMVLIVFNRRLSEQMVETVGELEASEKRYQSLVDNIMDVIFEIGLEGSLSYFSPQVKQLLGYSPEEILEREMSDLIHPEDLPLINETLEEIKNSGTNESIECRLLKKSKGHIHASIRTSLVKDNNGKAIKVVGVIRDITEKKKAEKVLKEQYEKLKEIDQIRTDLIRRTSHELKTPLLSIYSSSEYLLDMYKEELNDDILKVVSTINRGGKRLKVLTDNLIASYNIETNKLELKKENVDIIKIIKECAYDMVFSLEERDLYLKEDLDGSYFIEVDKMKLEQVILNLLSNAIKNTPSKGLIHLSFKENPKSVDIILKDTGVGLTDSEKEKIFQKFVKIERKGENIDVSNEGSGLGLYISKELVELHGGEIIVESEGRNKGSTFIVRLPRL